MPPEQKAVGSLAAARRGRLKRLRAALQTFPRKLPARSFLRLSELISLPQKPERLARFAEVMRSYTLKEKAKVAAGAATALVIVAWLAIIALALLSV